MGPGDQAGGHQRSPVHCERLHPDLGMVSWELLLLGRLAHDRGYDDGSSITAGLRSSH
jgi:hypothetical protein